MTSVPKVFYSGPARRDLDGIWDYIAQDNPDAADDFIDRLTTRCGSYARQPKLGESRSHVVSGSRAFSVGSYVVYYREVSNGIELIRVLHGARDVGRLL